MKKVKKEEFQSLKVKPFVANRFQKLTDSLGICQTESLELILNFFEANRLLTSEPLIPAMQDLEQHLKKKLDYMIAIIRDIENTQTRPTYGMLAALFENLPANNKPKTDYGFEKAIQNARVNIPTSYKEPHPAQEYKDILHLLEQIEHITPAFGKPYLKINLDRSELESIKYKYHVHHH